MGWNKGLTKETDPRIAKRAASLKESYRTGKVKTARGYLGKIGWSKGGPKCGFKISVDCPKKVEGLSDEHKRRIGENNPNKEL